MFRLLRIHTVPDEGKGSTWLQLFFDLVYVAILVELGNRLSHDLTLEGAVEFAFLFIPIWWSWLEFVLYGRYFPVDDIGQRVLTVLYMGFMLAMAFEIHDVTGETAAAFLVAYGLSKFVLALMYARAWSQFPEYRTVTSHFAIAFVLVGVLWIGIALLAPTSLWLWGLVMLIGILSPVISRFIRDLTGRSEQPHPPSKYHYMQHRFGELTIIVLGEFFIKLATTAEDRELTTLNIYIGLCLLGVSISLWWLYFDHLEHYRLSKAGSRLGAWIYSHYPFMVGITAYGVLGTKVFAATRDEPLDDHKRLLFVTALTVALLAYGAIEWATKEKDEPLTRNPQPWLRFAGAAVLLALGILGGSLHVGVLVTIVVAVFLIQIGFDVHKRLQRPESEAADSVTPA
ncbi:MAG: low temperature requirement protein A [Chloroflexota bacterium]|nr:MAG: low temperature requirement protein A [Chloroflexota bacterium]